MALPLAIPLLARGAAPWAVGAVLVLALAAGAYLKGRSDGFALGDVGRVRLEATIADERTQRAAELRALETKRRDINEQTQASYRSRLDAADRDYQRLRDADADRGANGVPSDADAAGRADDAAERGELLATLRAAEIDRLKLLELQEWIRNSLGTRQ
jgi:hypothetical protein